MTECVRDLLRRSTRCAGPGVASACRPVRGPVRLCRRKGPRWAGRPGCWRESFLPGPVAAELGRVLAAAERAHQPVRLGLAVPPELAGLPWEALPRPDGRGPLALHPLVSLFRKTDAASARLLPGPLRIVVAIAAPDSGGGAVLDYEEELRNVLAAVRAARQDAADVRVVPFATPAAIRDELDRGPAHVLHISGHGSPGTLDLENEDGSARPVTAGAVPGPGHPAGPDAAGDQPGGLLHRRGRQPGRGLLRRPAVRTGRGGGDRHRDLHHRYLRHPAAGPPVRHPGPQASDPDVVAALSDARREVQAELETSPDKRDNELAGLGEWAAVTVLAASGSVPVLDAGRTAPAVAQPSRPRIAGLAAREDWYFVGRRREQRRWPADLTGPNLAGIVVHGIGGTGKTTLAAEITTRVLDRDPGRVLVSLTGPLTLESLLGAVTSAIRRELLVRGGQDSAAIRALDVAARADVGWRDRLAILRGHVLDHVPVLVLLDNFEDNLRPDGDPGMRSAMRCWPGCWPPG